MKRLILPLNVGLLCFYLCCIVYVNAASYYQHTFRQQEVRVIPDDNPLKKAQQYLFHLLMVSEYRFFSPNISDSFVLGISSPHPLTGAEVLLPVSFTSPEMINRIHTTYFQFYEKDYARDAVAHSLAVHFFQQYPDISTLDFRFFLYKLPSMQAYRTGQTATLDEVYHNTFSLH